MNIVVPGEEQDGSGEAGQEVKKQDGSGEAEWERRNRTGMEKKLISENTELE